MLVLLYVAFCLVRFCLAIFFDGRVVASGDYEYSISINGGSARVIKYNGDDEVVKIPNRFMFMKVIAMNEEAFSDNDNLQEITIPSSVREIEANAFRNCTALQKVNFTGRIGYIHEYAFFNCSSLQTLELPYSDKIVIIEESAFESCSSLKSVDFRNSQVYVDTYAFYDCDSLENVYGASRLSSSYDAFDNTALERNCSGNDYFIIGSCLVKYLGSNKDVVVPDEVSDVSQMAFADKGVESIHMPSGINEFNLRFTSDLKNLPTKVKLYYGNVEEFDPGYNFGYLRDNVVLYAPAGSAVIDYAKRNGIEYIVE